MTSIYKAFVHLMVEYAGAQAVEDDAPLATPPPPADDAFDNTRLGQALAADPGASGSCTQ